MTDKRNYASDRFPLNDVAYDLIAMIHKKSQALVAYEKYLEDVQSDTQLTQLLVTIRHDDMRHLELLKAHLGRVLNPQAAAK